MKITDNFIKKYNKIDRAMIIRHCYPYCIILDMERQCIAFKNRNNYFLRDYPEDVDLYWFPLALKTFEKLQFYFSAYPDEIHFQCSSEKFFEFYLYCDDNPPMDKRYYNRYRKILNEIVRIIDLKEVSNRLLPDEEGFDFGSKIDGVLFGNFGNIKTQNVYKMARCETDSYPVRLYC